MKICLIRAQSTGHRTVPGWSLTTPAVHCTMPYGAGQASADAIISRRRPEPVRYVTTIEIILKIREVPGRLSNSNIIKFAGDHCKSLTYRKESVFRHHSINWYYAWLCQYLVVTPNKQRQSVTMSQLIKYFCNCIWLHRKKKTITILEQLWLLSWKSWKCLKQNRKNNTSSVMLLLYI